MPTASVLVVDDDKLVRRSLVQALQRAGYAVNEADCARETLTAVELGVDLVLLDLRSGAEGLSWIERIRGVDPDTIVIVMTARSSIDEAVDAMKRGAYHYAAKPVDVGETLLVVERALETTRLRRELKLLRESRFAAFGVDRIIGESTAMLEVKEKLALLAASNSTALITGESGTGKDLVANVMHCAGERAERSFVTITCTALPESLLESELFGHERGAFTDAHHMKKGLLELAHGGTVFLDEIGDMSPGLQAKLLRFLEERTLRRVGGSTDIRVDVRIIAATNRDLEADVRANRFREDLYYRLAVLPLTMPPLRERKGDAILLFRHFVDKVAPELRRVVHEIARDAAEQLEGHSWPGNIRELRNVAERTLLFLEGDTVRARDLHMAVRQTVDPAVFQLPAEGADLVLLERSLLRQALERTRGNQRMAAALLGLNRDQVRYRLRKYGLDPKSGDSG